MSDEASERLRGILGELHEVLESVADLDDSSREALRSAVAEIQGAIDSDSDSDAGSQLAGLRERIESFEGSHPRLTDTVRRIVDQLSEMGI
jgi:hypothetical protein